VVGILDVQLTRPFGGHPYRAKMIILGISAYYHDAAAVLLRDGVLVGAAQEERFTKVKHDPSLPVRAVNWLLEEAEIAIEDVDYVVFYEKPLRKFERILSTAVAYFPWSWRIFPDQMHAWLGDKLWMKSNIMKGLGISKEKLLFSEHHMSHAASAFFPSPFERAVILTVDGVGEWATTALWLGEGQNIEPISEIRYPHSLGMFYSSITAHLGFAVNSGEYKVMGMAAYGEPVFMKEMEELLHLHDDGSFTLNLEYFQFHLHPQEPMTERSIVLLGERRHAAAEFDPFSNDQELRKHSLHYANIAASAQLRLEQAMLHLLRHAKSLTGERRLCLAGGVSLNASANRVLAESGIFEEIWAQPAAGDAGGALGAALWCWHMVHGAERGIEQGIALGRAWDPNISKGFLEDFGLDFQDCRQNLVETVAQDLAEGLIVAWMDGRFEWGPRALGHRSILASPARKETADRINSMVKFRELFRPFAPMCLFDRADEYFEIPDAARPMLPYMLCTVGVREDKRSMIPAVTHIDGSARVQLVDEKRSPLLYEILRRFEEKSGLPILLNTSFNMKGDAMVSSPVDAVATFKQSDIEVMYIDGFRVLRSERKRSRK
jgi:carbamoyltransferase